MTIATLLLALVALPNGAERSGEPLLLDFTATWCGPCRQMKPAVEQLVENGYRVRPVDIDRSPELAEKYQVTGVPTFVAIDPATGRELGRTSGAQPVGQLVKLYQQARRQLQTDADDRTGDSDSDEDAPARPKASPNPDPWETVVRIKVHGQGSIGFGSGTVVYSSPKESIILTCAHIFKMDGRQQARPDKFPLRITVDLFDGKLSGYRPAQVHYANETYEGEALDYDFDLDVGLIRIRPGRRLPYARVVPQHWQPKARMGMITVGCSEGHDATAWNTVVVNPQMRGLAGHNTYEAIECTTAPKQGRSGGGLFTSDGYVAGVCDFAEPRGDHGLYAHPASIYKILDRNKLMALYAPVSAPGEGGAILAKNDRGPRRTGPATDVRLQSPEDTGSVTMPPPEMLGIATPRLADAGSRPSGGRRSWHPSPSTKATELNLDPSLDTDRFDRGGPGPRPAAVEPEVDAPREAPAARETPAPREAPASPGQIRPAPGRWRAGRAPLPALSGAAD